MTHTPEPSSNIDGMTFEEAFALVSLNLLVCRTKSAAPAGDEIVGVAE